MFSLFLFWNPFEPPFYESRQLVKLVSEPASLFLRCLKRCHVAEREQRSRALLEPLFWPPHPEGLVRSFRSLLSSPSAGRDFDRIASSVKPRLLHRYR